MKRLKYVNKSMLESIILFYHYTELFIFTNSSNVVFSIKIPGNPHKIFVNNEKLQKLITE